VFLAGSIGCDRTPDPVLDDLSTDKIARRIVSLAPHLTELAYTAGAGDRLVGVVDFSDFPFAAKLLPRVGDAFHLDYEVIAALEPDLILGWQSGTSANVLNRLRELGYRVVALEPGRLDSIAAHLRIIGVLTGTLPAADSAATEYETQLRRIRDRYQGVEILSVFYQVSVRPLLTISRHHVIDEVIGICGGRNIFSGLDSLAPAVTLEAVLDRSPQVIVASNFGNPDGADSDALTTWSTWTHIPAVRNGNLFLIDADQIVRPSTRILGGIRQVCVSLDEARGKSVADNIL
jgi:iron complex transport system substrate-binding protein